MSKPGQNTSTDSVTIDSIDDFLPMPGADSIVTEVKTKMEDNVRGALIGGGIGLIIGIATRKNLIVSGIIGLVLGRFIFKAN